MALRLIFVALIALVLGLTILQQSIWGGMGLRKGTIFTFIGFSFLGASIVLGTLAYLILRFGWQDLFSPAIVLSPILLGLSILGAIGVYVRRRSLQRDNSIIPNFYCVQDKNIDYTECQDNSQ